jgi:hypothetical protein
MPRLGFDPCQRRLATFQAEPSDPPQRGRLEPMRLGLADHDTHREGVSQIDAWCHGRHADTEPLPRFLEPMLLSPGLPAAHARDAGRSNSSGIACERSCATLVTGPGACVRVQGAAARIIS